MKKIRKILLLLVLCMAVMVAFVPMTDVQVNAEGGNYLKFTAQQANSSITVKFSSGSYEYKLDSSESWTAGSNGTKIELNNKGASVLLRGTNCVTDFNNHFVMTGKIAASGDVTALTNNVGGDASMTYNCYRNMFRDCTSLTKAPNLPSSTLAGCCYYAMFLGCKNLTTAPSLPATTLKNNCYNSMFSGCSSLFVAETGSNANKIFTCPSTSGIDNPVTDMFKDTAGSFKGTPGANNSYFVNAVTVAKVYNGTALSGEYTSLQDAIDNASGKTVKLEAKVSITDTITMPVGNTITLDLNGKTISNGAYLNMFEIGTGSKLVVKDSDSSKSGKIENSYNKTIFDVSGGELTIKSGTYEVSSVSGEVLLCEGGTATVEGGTFEVKANAAENKYGSILLHCINSGSSITVKDGTFTTNDTDKYHSSLFSTDTKGTIEVQGGTFNGNIYSTDKNAFKSIIIKGGSFSTNSGKDAVEGNSINLVDVVHDDYEVSTTTSPYMVTKIKAFMVGGKFFANFGEAFEAAKSSNTIVVLKDVAMRDAYTIDKNVVLNLNGHSLNGVSNEKAAFTIVDGGKLTVKDTNTAKTGTIYSYNKNTQVFRIDGGELIVNSGNFKIKIDTYVAYVNPVLCLSGKATLNGGTFTVESGYNEADNFYSSVIAAAQKSSDKKSVINVNGGVYNAKANGKFKSRIFTSYKGDNYDFGVINIKGGYFNGEYDNEELIDITSYTRIVAGSFDRYTFENEQTLMNLIDTDKYTVVETKDTPARYKVCAIGENGNIKTGDSNNIMLYLGVLAITLLAIETMLFVRTRKEK